MRARLQSEIPVDYLERREWASWAGSIFPELSTQVLGEQHARISWHREQAQRAVQSARRHLLRRQVLESDQLVEIFLLGELSLEDCQRQFNEIRERYGSAPLVDRAVQLLERRLEGMVDPHNIPLEDAEGDEDNEIFPELNEFADL